MLDYLDQRQIRIRRENKLQSGTVTLTGSKSESNRALLLRALSKGLVQADNLSEADDTRLMAKSLLAALPGSGTESGQRRTIDVGPAGTVMRFMTAYLAITPGKYTLSGSERMHERPIGVLVDALREMGADIQYVGREGYPPLTINGGFGQLSDDVAVAGNISSQYLSALLLIAPALPNGLGLRIRGSLTSRPYLTMTLAMLAEAGVQHHWEGDTISIAPQSFQQTTLSIEPDWSAASYWYSLLALSASGEIFLPGLKEASLQGDRMIVSMMEHFGIQSTFTADGVRLRKESKGISDGVLLDFTECPDIAQTVVACAAALQKDMSFKGLHTLRIKETDRILALQTEIAKFGVHLIADDDGETYHLRTSDFHKSGELVFDTYQDHRMAMAFAPLAMIFDSIKINNPLVVEKSYPKFWVHLQSMGFTIKH